MANFQDKLCNALTYIGLTGVIIFGTASLWPSENETTPLLDETEQPEMPEHEQTPTDTLKEVPMIDESYEEPKIKAEDTLNTALPDSTLLQIHPDDTTLHVNHEHSKIESQKSVSNNHEHTETLNEFKDKKEEKANKQPKEENKKKATQTHSDEAKQSGAYLFE